jgi:hypothetical protein
LHALAEHGWQRSTAAAAQAAAVGAVVHADAAQRIETSLQQLQHSVASLQAEPCTDGLLTAYQQLRHIMQQLLQEQRRCQASIHRTKWKMTAGRQQQQQQQGEGTAGSPSKVAELNMSESEQLQQLRQLRGRGDDAQDYLIGLIHAHLQVSAAAATCPARICISAAVLPACHTLQRQLEQYDKSASSRCKGI